MSRFWQAKQEDIRIEKLVRCPKIPNIHTLDVVVLEDGNQYKIEQIQEPQDIKPSCLDLSLSMIKVRLELNPVIQEEVPDDQPG